MQSILNPKSISDGPQSHRFALLCIYFFSNIYAAWLFIDARATTHEFSGLSVAASDVLSACVLALSSLFAFALIVQPMLTRLVNSAKPRLTRRNSRGIGIVVLGILIAQIVFSITSGSQLAGQLNYIDNPGALFFLIFNGDYMFLAYYCFYRESKLCPVNMVLYVISGLIRGWGGMFLIIGFLEIGRQLRLRQYWSIFFISTALMLLAPGIDLFRNLVRAMGSDMQSAEVLSLLNPDVFHSLSDSSGSLATVAAATAETILLRLQHIEVDLVTNTFHEHITLLYDKGLIRPFYAEGAIGKLLLQLLDERVGPDLHLFLPGYFHGWSTYYNVGYSVHAGFGSWLGILGMSFPLVVLYACLMVVFAALLIRWNGGTREAEDVAWLMGLLFICSGWFGPYEAFLQALILLLGIEALLACISLGSMQARKGVVRPTSSSLAYPGGRIVSPIG